MAFLVAAALTFATGACALLILPRDSGAPARAHKNMSQRKVWRDMLQNPLLQVIWCSNALVFLAVSGVLLSTLVVLVDARGIRVLALGSQGSAGMLMAFLMLFRAAAALGAGTFLDRRSGRTALLLPGAVLMTAGFAGLALAAHVWSMALALAAIGLGGGALNIPLLTLLSDTARHQTQGRAMALYQLYGDVGGSLGPIVGLELGAFTGYGPIYVGVACTMSIVAVPLYWLVRRERTAAK
jgi:MFS family permease